MWVVAAACALSANARAETYIIEEGRPNAEIVVAEHSANMSRLAAEQLREHLATMTGAELDIVPAPTGRAAVKVYVGPGAHSDRLGLEVADLDHGAYRMVSGEDWLALLGRDRPFLDMRSETAAELLRLAYLRGDDEERAALWERWYELSGGNWGLPYSQLWRGYNKDLDIRAQDEHGSFNAVVAFLRSLGMRWYMPSELGQVVPQRADVRLPEVNRTARPDFPVRFANQRRFSGSRDEALWELWLGFNRATEVIGATFPQHGLMAVTETRTERALFAHPGAATPRPADYYAMYGGERQVHGPVFHGRRFGSKQCLSSPGLLDETLRYARARFDVLGSPLVSLMPADGFTSICQCERCVGKESPELGYRGKLSNYVWGFVDRVARELYKTHPDRRVLGGAYGTYVVPPTNIERFSPNVLVQICQHRQKFTQQPEVREHYVALRGPYLQRLGGRERSLLIYEYYRGDRHTPHYNTHAIAEDLRRLKGVSPGDTIDVQRDSWSDYRRDGYTPLTKMSVQHLDLYVTARCYWDADLDLDALLEEYYRNFYGRAAAEMKALIEFGEANWMTIPGDGEKIGRTLDLLAAAQEKVKAAPDSPYARRIALIADYLRPLERLREQNKIERGDAPELIMQDRTGKEVTIDGRLNDPFWKGVRIWSRGELKELHTGGKPGFRTGFKAGWADGSLHFGIHCYGAKGDPVNITATERDQQSIWSGDCVEIELEPPGHSYYRIAIAPSGAVVDLDRALPKATRHEWTAEAEVATHVGEDFWSLEVRIPAAGAEQAEVLPFQGVAGNKPSQAFPWYFNICRQRRRGDDRELSAFSPTEQPGGDFHRPEKFARLWVGRKKSKKPLPALPGE